MKVVVIGAGNVATHLAYALKKANVVVSQIWSNHYENALTLSNAIEATAISNLSDIDHTADLCLIAIKDDAVKAVSSQLADFKGIVAHTSGAVSLEVFEGNFENYGVFYPLQTFSKAKLISFEDIPLCLEANNETTLDTLTDLAARLSEKVLNVDSEKRKVLHLAAVFACNFTNYMYALAEEILSVNELGFEIIRPLIAETANKVQCSLPAEVQTGPAIRGDEATMKKHEEMLLQHPLWLNIYQTLSKSIKKSI